MRWYSRSAIRSVVGSVLRGPASRGHWPRPAHALAACAGVCLILRALPLSTLALDEARFVEFAPTPNAVRLVSNGVAAPIVVDAQDYAGVRRAAGDLQADLFRVAAVQPRLLTDKVPRTADVVVVGSLERSRLIQKLIGSRKLDVGEIRHRWEATIVQVVARPWPGVERALVIAGSDQRGAIFGVYDVSEQIGVSPWYWWADVPIHHRDELFVRAGRYVRGEPAVRYRGVFINDEAPALSGWAREKFGGFNHRFYGHVFELLLRLRANFLWPAMWGNAFNDDDRANPALADEYGIVMGTSHHEPMMRAHDEWRRYGTGPWNYETNAEALRAFWTEGIRQTAGYENIVTLGMRGDGDAPMSEAANVALLQRIVADQRAIIVEHRNRDITAVPQVWALYKEVQEYYEKGMRVPDDVTLLWADDNWGNIRRLPTPEERARPGGSGVYYHFDYVGGPRSYKWLNTIPIAKIWEQMHLAYRYGATRIWIVNVGDIKPMEFPIQFFLDYAWDPERYPAERLSDYTRAWAEREFGPEHASEIADIVTQYTTYNGRRKPEMLDPRTYSLVDYREAEIVVDGYQRLARRAEELYAAMPPAARDAFYQLVLHPVKACAVLNDLYVTVGRNRLYAVQGRAATNDLADRARALFRQDGQLSREYNETLAGGKWNHMMDQTHIGYTYWNQPVRNAMPAVQEIQVPPAGEMGIAVEGSEAGWPGGAGGPVLPALSVYDGQPRYLDVFNRGEQPFAFTIEVRDPWLQVDVPRGTVGRGQRIWVSARWNEVPVGADRGALTVTGPNGVKVEVVVPILNPTVPRPSDLDGFVEANGYVSIEAEHCTRAVAPAAREWKVIPNHGRTLSGVTPWPVTTAAVVDPTHGMRLEYHMYLFSQGAVSVEVYLASTQKFQPGPGFRYAMSF
ncbi:MAG: glycosyl hydrolase 115 family protein, partial [Acidobacteria bacterium]|nr:glycosyl hydrolase 115 family protein [Acidobacteriota bacterium]